jgi:hypothetical protein
MNAIQWIAVSLLLIGVGIFIWGIYARKNNIRDYLKGTKSGPIIALIGLILLIVGSTDNKFNKKHK